MARKPKSFLSPALFGLLLKGSKLIGVLKALQATKFLITGGSILVSVLAWDLFLSPWTSVALISMLLIHEMGHVWALHRLGFGARWPVFVPFLGAMIFAPTFEDRNTDAMVGAAGPLLGTLATVLCVALWYHTHVPLLHTAALFGIWINLFNMLPANPFDGGRICQVIDSKIRYAGLLMMFGFTMWLGEPSLILLWVLFLSDFHHLPRWWRPNLAAGLTIGMTALMYAGYSHQDPVIDTIDMVAAITFTLLYWQRDHSRTPAYDHWRASLPTRPYPPLRDRLWWLVTYVGLVGSLLAMLWFLTPSS